MKTCGLFTGTTNFQEADHSDNDGPDYAAMFAPQPEGEAGICSGTFEIDWHKASMEQKHNFYIAPFWETETVRELSFPGIRLLKTAKQARKFAKELKEERNPKPKGFERDRVRCLAAKKAFLANMVESGSRLAEPKYEFHMIYDEAMSRVEALCDDYFDPNQADDKTASVAALEERFESKIIIGLWEYAKEYGCLPATVTDTQNEEIWAQIYEITAWLRSGELWLRDEDVKDDLDEVIENAPVVHKILPACDGDVISRNEECDVVSSMPFEQARKRVATFKWRDFNDADEI